MHRVVADLHELSADSASTGTYDHTFANIYPVGDAFRYLVEWMSDNQMTCSSPLFDTGGDLYGTAYRDWERVIY